MQELTVTDDHGERNANTIFIEAFKFWELFLGDFGFIEGRPVLGGKPVRAP